jgi:hypothetical protein
VKQNQCKQDDRQDHRATATPDIVCHFVAGHVIVRLGEEMCNVADGVPRRRRRNVVLPTGLLTHFLDSG